VNRFCKVLATNFAERMLLKKPILWQQNEMADQWQRLNRIFKKTKLFKNINSWFWFFCCQSVIKLYIDRFCRQNKISIRTQMILAAIWSNLLPNIPTFRHFAHREVTYQINYELVIHLLWGFYMLNKSPKLWHSHMPIMSIFSSIL